MQLNILIINRVTIVRNNIYTKEVFSNYYVMLLQRLKNMLSILQLQYVNKSMRHINPF